MNNNHGGNLILLDAQTFTMGCTAGQQNECFDNEYPAHEVTLNVPFYIGETEVTQAEYASVMEGNPSYFAACGGDCPVEQVSWHDAAAFANALSLSEGVMACSSLLHLCLPTHCTCRPNPNRWTFQCQAGLRP